MKEQILPILTIILLTSCLSTKKFTGFVQPKFQDEEAKSTPTTDNFIIDLSKLEKQNGIVVSTKLKSQFIPAILYWSWENTIKCDINPNIVGKTFQESFLQFAVALKLQEKLKDRKLEIKVEQIPNSFVYTHKGNSLIFIVAYTVRDLEAIIPQEKNLVVSYKLTQDGATVKEGNLTSTNKDQGLKNAWKSTKKFTWLYLDQFKQNSRTMTKEIVEKLLTEI